MIRFAIVAAAVLCGCIEKLSPDRFVCGAGDCRVDVVLVNRLPAESVFQVDVIAEDLGPREILLTRCTGAVAGSSSLTCTSSAPLNHRIRFEPGPGFVRFEGDCFIGEESCGQRVEGPLEVRALFDCVPQCQEGSCDDGCGGPCPCGEGERCEDGLCVCPCSPGECGFNACGATCGGCPNGEVCANGLCCAPRCEGRECGSNGCVGVCGSCQQGERCIDGTCCAPQCAGRRCGDDGCGGTCGAECPPPAECVDGVCVTNCEPREDWIVPVTFLIDNSASMGQVFGARPCSECPFHCAMNGLSDLSRHERAKAAWLGCAAPNDGALATWTASTTLGFVGFRDVAGSEWICPGAPLLDLYTAINIAEPSGGGDYVDGLVVAARAMNRTLVSNEVRPGSAAIVIMSDGGRSSVSPTIELDLACDGSTLSIPWETPELAGAYLYQHDILCHVLGDQPIRTYAISFNPEPGDLLPGLTALAGGAYFQVSTATEAQTALQMIFDDLRP